MSDTTLGMHGNNMMHSNAAMADGTVSIREVEDVILDNCGQMIGIVVEVGGFLEIGDRHVLPPVSDGRIVLVDDKTHAFLTRLTEEQLEELPWINLASYNSYRPICRMGAFAAPVFRVESAVTSQYRGNSACWTRLGASPYGTPCAPAPHRYTPPIPPRF